jgi:hypothetical protein
MFVSFRVMHVFSVNCVTACDCGVQIALRVIVLGRLAGSAFIELTADIHVTNPPF